MRNGEPGSCYKAFMDAKDRFSQAADDYAKYRPGYPPAIVEACAAYAGLQPGASVVDIGCGTGISSRLFADAGYEVTGIEPNDAMRQKAVRHSSGQTPAGGPVYMEGSAEETGLDADFADLITCAQALHWFDLDDCVAEWRRILKSPPTESTGSGPALRPFDRAHGRHGSGQNAACAAFWNYRRDDGWQAEYEGLLGEWSSEYGDVRKAVDGGQDNSAWVKNSPVCTDVTEHEFEYAQRMDLPSLIGRANSSSYVIHGVEDKPGFERALTDLFQKHAQDAHVEFRYRTYLLLWRFTEPKK